MVLGGVFMGQEDHIRHQRLERTIGSMTDLMLGSGIFLENKFRGSKSSLSKIEGQNFNHIIDCIDSVTQSIQSMIILKSIISLRHNSGGANHFQGGQNDPFSAFRIKLMYFPI